MLLKLSHQYRKVQSWRRRLFLLNGRLCFPHIRIGVERHLKLLRIDFSILIQDVRIDFCHHIWLCMSSVALRGFHITMIQLQLLCCAGMSKRMEHHIRQVCLLFQAVKRIAYNAILAGPSCLLRQDEVVVDIILSHEFL